MYTCQTKTDSTILSSFGVRNQALLGFFKSYRETEHDRHKRAQANEPTPLGMQDVREKGSSCLQESSVTTQIFVMKRPQMSPVANKNKMWSHYSLPAIFSSSNQKPKNEQNSKKPWPKGTQHITWGCQLPCLSGQGSAMPEPLSAALHCCSCTAHAAGTVAAGARVPMSHTLHWFHPRSFSCTGPGKLNTDLKKEKSHSKVTKSVQGTKMFS